MKDDRKVPVTITMTMEEWDSLGFGLRPPGAPHDYTDSQSRRYARDHDWKARQTIAGATPGAAGRRAAALAEIEAKLPKLTNEKKLAIEREIKRLFDKFMADDLNVDHLGYGPDSNPYVAEGFGLTLIPNISGGGSSFHFALAPDIWFEGHQQSMKAEDKDWFIDAVKRIAGYKHHWNDYEKFPDSPWISVAFR